jgi:Dienelactone hydrolase family
MHMKLNEETVDYRDGETELSGLLVWDDSELARPGILVVHGGAGLDDHAKGRARQLANLGLVAFACDMYGAGVIGDRERVMATITGLIGSRDKLCQRALAGINVLASDPRVNGSIVAVGYCFGGRTVLEVARSGADLAGVISSRQRRDSQPSPPGRGQGEDSGLSWRLGPARPNRAGDRIHRRDEHCRNRLPAHRLWRRDARLHPRRRHADARS